MSVHSPFYGEDAEDAIFEEISEDEVTEYSTESEEDEGTQFGEAFQAEANNKKVRKSSKDSEEKLSGQKSQSSSKAESRKNSIQSEENEIRSRSESLESPDVKSLPTSSKKHSKASKISAKSIVSESVSILSGEQDASRKSSQQKVQLPDSEKVEVTRPLVAKLAQKMNRLGDNDQFRPKQRRFSAGQTTIVSYADSAYRRESFNSVKKITHQLESTNPFSKFEAASKIDKIVAIHLVGLRTYDHDKASTMAGALAKAVQGLFQKNHYDRYKIAVQVIIGEKHRQGVNIDARCLWDHQRDHLVKRIFERTDYFVLVLCCGVYHD